MTRAQRVCLLLVLCGLAAVAARWDYATLFLAAAVAVGAAAAVLGLGELRRERSR